jgi:hypothetical protein
MKHIKLFEQFVNEKKDWWDFDPEKIAQQFIKDGEPGEGPNVTTSQLQDWLNDFAYAKKIQAGLPSIVGEDIIEVLKKKGYKKLDVKELITYG